MNTSVKLVEPNQDFTSNFTFVHNERKIFDVKPYLEYGVFTELKDSSLLIL
jgi:hypothetical protein